MPKQDPNLTHLNLSHQEIIKLGKVLASLPNLKSQKTYLNDFFLTNFSAEVLIWLKSPPKFIESWSHKDFLPFKIDNKCLISEDKVFEIQENFSEGQYWYLFPLVQENQSFGKLILKLEKSLDSQTLSFIKQLSTVIGLAIYTRLLSDLHDWRKKQLTLVQSVSEQISQITDLDLLANKITKLVQESFKYYYVAVFLINFETLRLHFKASAGPEDTDRPEFEHESHPGFELGEHIIGYVAQTGHELIANDVTKEPKYKAVDSLKETRSEVVIPLRVEGRIFGVFDIQSDRVNAFDEEDLLVLRALANSISIAIQSAHLYQGLQKRADHLATVSEVSRTITHILDLDELFQRIVHLIHDRFNFPYVHLYTTDLVQERITFKAGSGKRAQLYEDKEICFDLNAKTGIVVWVGKQGQTKRVNNVKEEPLFIASREGKITTGSEMAIPLNFAGETLGVLDIQSDQEHAFSMEDQQLMETLADNVAIAIRNARLYHSEKWRRQVAESMRDVSGLLSENTALNDVLQAILEKLHQNLPCDIAGIWLSGQDLDENLPLESQELYLAAYQSNDDYPSEILGKLTLTPDTWVKNALTHREPTIRKPEDTIGPIAKHFNLPATYSSIAAPLQTGGAILGMLTLVHHTPGRYGYESQKITSTFANYAAIAIKNTRLFATSQEQAWISTILLEVAQATQSLTNIDELVTTIVRITPMVVGVKGCALFLRESESNIFSLYAFYGIGDLTDDLNLEKPLPLLDAPIFDDLIATHEPLIVRSPKEDFNLPDRFVYSMKKDTLTLLPLIARNEVIGAFMIANDSDNPSESAKGEIIDDEGLKVIQGIIQQTAIAVENIRLLEEKQEEAYISTVLLQAAQAVVSGTSLEDTLDSLVHLMPILVGIDSSVIYLWDKSKNCFSTSHATVAGKSNENGFLDNEYDVGDFPMLDTIFRHNRPIVHPFTETILPPEDWDLVLPDEGQTDPTPILQSRFPLLMGFPLSMQDEVFGVLLAQEKQFSTNRERRFELIWGIAQQASMAIQNDIINKEMLNRQRLEREFQLAREIQQTFLPDETPEMPGWEMDVLWETARQVGGDFYDYFLLPDGRLGFVIADVSDKGLAASLYMTVTRTLLRAAALESNSPAETLENVNDLLLMNSQEGFFITTFYGVLSLNDGSLTYAIAGHNPPFIIRYNTNEVIEFEKGGIALGALPNIHLEQNELILKPGDCLVLYTDGVTEAFNKNEQMYGEKRLKRILTTTIGEGAHNVVETLKADLSGFRGDTSLSDDTTILAICRTLH